MKSTLLKSAVLLVSVFGTFSSAAAETLHAHIPFAFSAAGTSMPAGTYAIRTMAHAPQVLLFEHEETRMQAMVFVRTAPGVPDKLSPPVTFAEGSEQMELINIAASDRTYELSTHARKALKGVALTLTNRSK